MIWHNASFDDVAAELQTDKNNGLSSDEAAKRLKKYGYNEIHDFVKKSFFAHFLRYFRSFSNIALIAVALLYAVLSFALNLNRIFDAVIIIVLVLFNCLFSATVKYISARDLDKMRNSVASFATVIRDGKETVIPSNELVVGDIMVLKCGDYIKADARLFDAYVLKCDEFRITGETIPCDKIPEASLDNITPLNRRANMVYSGSVVVNGRGLAIVTETGKSTEIGRIESLEKATATSNTELELQLTSTEKKVRIVFVAISIIIAFCGIAVNFSVKDISFAVVVTYYVLLGLSVYCSTATHNLRLFTAAATARSAMRLKQNDVAVTNFASLEVLKDIDVICTDKTGTLTTEELLLRKIFNGQKTVSLSDDEFDDSAAAVLRLALICSNFSHDEHTEKHTNNIEHAIEQACIKYAGMSKKDLDDIFPKLAELPFDSERKLMTTVTSVSGNTVAIVKGAPEIIIERCVDIEFDKINKIATEYAAEGLKVIAVAVKQLPDIPANPNSDDLENELTFAGIIAFEDKIDSNMYTLCKECGANGIRVIMLTGDHIDTAVAIGQKLGIISDAAQAISGDKLSEFNDEELKEVVLRCSVFARVSPEDKKRIVSAFKACGNKVLVTGDSTNDTPALLEADIGCALGITASDAVKDAADVVVRDNKFSSIINAVKESHSMFFRVKSATIFYISASISTLLIILFGLIVFAASPMLCSTLLVLNLLTLLLPTVALLTEKHTSASLKKRRLKFTDTFFAATVLITSVFTTIIALVGYGIEKSTDARPASACVFTIVVICRIVSAFCLSHYKTVLLENPLKQPLVPIACIIALFAAILVQITPISDCLSLSPVLNWQIFIITFVITLILIEALKITFRLLEQKTRE